MPTNVPEPRPGEEYTPLELTDREARIINLLAFGGSYPWEELREPHLIAWWLRNDIKHQCTPDEIAALVIELDAMVDRGLLWFEDGKYRNHTVGWHSEMLRYYKRKYPEKFKDGQ